MTQDATLTPEQAVAESWAPTCVKTGKKAVGGCCPEHGGDSCLMASEMVRAILAEREACAEAVAAELSKLNGRWSLDSAYLSQALAAIRART